MKYFAAFLGAFVLFALLYEQAYGEGLRISDFIAALSTAIAFVAFYYSHKAQSTAASLQDYDYQPRLRLEEKERNFVDGFKFSAVLKNKGQKPVDVIGVDMVIQDQTSNETMSVNLCRHETLMPAESLDIAYDSEFTLSKWLEGRS